MVPLLDKLERRGLVARQSSTTDRRHNHLFLTDEGAQLLEEARPRVVAHNNRMCGALTAAERKTLMGLLAKMCK